MTRRLRVGRRARFGSVLVVGVVLSALAASSCAIDVESAPQPSVPAVAPHAAKPKPASLIALTATLTVAGDTVTVTGTSNLPDGAALVWALAEPIAAFMADPDTVLRDSEGGMLEGVATVANGAYAFVVTNEAWGELGLCDVLPLELWVSYYPYAELVPTLPAQPESLYALHGEQGELITGAVPPAELVERNSEEMGFSQRVELDVTCP